VRLGVVGARENLDTANESMHRTLVQTVFQTIWAARGVVVTPTGLEPVTSSSGGWRSIQLSYGANSVDDSTLPDGCQAERGVV
jgi:hypothetical protein